MIGNSSPGVQEPPRNHRVIQIVAPFSSRLSRDSQHPLGILPRQFGYPLSFRGQVCGTQSSLPCFSSMGLNAWRLPSLQRVLVSPVPRLHQYYEAPTTSRRACPSAYGFASGFHMPWRFVLAYALPMLAKSIIGPGACSAGAPGRLPHVDTNGTSQVSW